MRSNKRVLLTVACLALAALSCQALTALGGGTPTTSGRAKRGSGFAPSELSPLGWLTDAFCRSEIDIGKRLWIEVRTRRNFRKIP